MMLFFALSCANTNGMPLAHLFVDALQAIQVMA